VAGEEPADEGWFLRTGRDALENIIARILHGLTPEIGQTLNIN
jgi:hypothetical protein